MRIRLIERYAQPLLPSAVIPPLSGTNNSRAMTVSYAAGTGNAVTDLIFSIAKREVTFFSGTAPISFL